VEVSSEGREARNVSPNGGIERERPLDIDAPLRVADQEDFARYALLGQRLNIVRDVLGVDLCIAKGAGWRREPGNIITRTGSLRLNVARTCRDRSKLTLRSAEDCDMARGPRSPLLWNLCHERDRLFLRSYCESHRERMWSPRAACR
jgi:hypothetical protein